jgi:hypothetical protein
MAEKKIKILTIFGTRKEFIRLYPVLEIFNRRRTQRCADSIFPLADSRDGAALARDKLAGENLHALRATGFIKDSLQGGQI